MSEQDDHETWEAWLPAGTVIPKTDLMTREVLLSSLHDQGVTVSKRDLVNWQAAGVIPYGVRRWHEESGSSRTLYPSIMVPLLMRLRHLQQDGMNLRSIGFQLRNEMAQGIDIPA